MTPFSTSFGTMNQVRQITQPSKTPRASGGVGLEDLQQTVQHQHLVIQTLLLLLMEKKVIQEEEFEQWMAYVDDLDGVRDGRVAAEETARPCPSCGRVNRAGAARCIYCEYVLPVRFLARRPE